MWALEKNDFKKSGFFVEFGATDGVLLSNTYLLEKEFLWDGICAEPNPKFYKELKKNRSCTISNACISGNTGDIVEFILANEYGGIAESAKRGKHKSKVEAYEISNKSLHLKTISLDDFLQENNAPEIIDYLSIDTEGSEYEILSSFPFDKWFVRCLSVEHNFGEQRELIYKLLSSLGYTRVACEWDDLYYKS
ncbi:FkbM family methyltransferase [Neptunomonas phycophila]|uniref:FkbM family methyltransferase n=1 Tax=Neptunomonas phycophila TaxID=1572645 RepID=UPI0015BFCF2D|nr:FkbM family methyltransferase [Neptunomonas phycophila]QLE96772.1 FkbM family methyltransferase [Neptunomonas phycophila]